MEAAERKEKVREWQYCMLSGAFFATVALVPAPREQAWRDGSCAFAGKEVRFVRDAALPPEGYRLDIAPDGVTVASVDEAGAFYARQTLK